MRKALFIFAGLVLVVAGLFYWIDLNKSNLNAWDLISSRALVIIESEDFNALQRKIDDKEKFSPAGIDKKRFAKLLESKRILFSIYKTDANRSKGLFIISDPEKHILDSLFKSEKTKQRNFNGSVIYDLPSKDEVISFTKLENLFVIGAPFLVEEAVRTAGSVEDNLFKKQNLDLFQLEGLKSDEGNIYLNLLQIGRSRSKALSNITYAKSAICDIKFNDNQIILNGFAIDSLPKPSFLSLFKNQKATSFSLKELVSQRSTFIEHYSFSNFGNWFSRQQTLFHQQDTVKKNLNNIQKKIDWPGFVKSVGTEIAICSIDKGDKGSTILVLKLVNEKGFETLNGISQDSTYREDHAGYPIRRLNTSFTNTIFWAICPRDLSYYASVNSHLIFAEDVNSLKNFINDIEEENTLGKSIEWNNFLSSSIQESTVNYYATGNGFKDELKFLGLDFLLTDYLSIDKVAIQLSSLDDHFYTSATIQLNEKGARTSSPTDISSSLIEFRAPIITEPYVVMNHSSKTSELLLQDSLNDIHLISQNKISWDLNMGNKIAGDIFQIDYLKNRKLQYFFVTKDQLHIVDRLGRELNGFPKTFAGQEFLFSRVVDYDQSKNYRFLVAKTGGEIDIYDEKGNGLEGWNPKKLEKTVIDAGHERILGKDYFFALLEDGQFYLFSRKGDVIKNFPIRTQTKVSGVLITHGKNMQSSYFSLLSDDGMLTQINLLGEMVKKEPLIKSSNQSRFGVVANQNKNGYIWRVDKNKIAILDPTGKVLFEKENPASENLAFNYFYSGMPVFTVFDKTQDLLLILDSNGKELTTQPIEATQIPSIEFLPGKKLRVNSVFKNRVSSQIIN